MKIFNVTIGAIGLNAAEIRRLILTIPLSALVKVILSLDTPLRRVQVPDRRPSSQFLHVVAREGAEVTGPLAGADVPSVVALLHHVHRVALLQLQLVVVLRLVIVQRSVSIWKKYVNNLLK